jgi:hypothetical protein
MAKHGKRFNRTKKEIAQTMVEFALVFPILLLLTYGIMEFGRILFIYISTTSSAREGARYGAATGEGANGIQQFADCAGIRTAVRNSAFLTSIPNDNNIQIMYELTPNSGFTVDCAYIEDHPDSINLGSRIRVIVRSSYTPLIPFLGIGDDPIMITRQNARTIIIGVEVDQR